MKRKRIGEKDRNRNWREERVGLERRKRIRRLKRRKGIWIGEKEGNRDWSE